MRKKLHKALAIFLLIFLPLTAQAQGYAPGTAGYVYEDCKRVLAESPSLQAAQNTYCGAFIEGYVMGLVSANMSSLPPAEKLDPCHDDREKAYDHINGRFCKNLPEFKIDAANAGNIIRTVADIIEKWVSYNREKLDQPATVALAKILEPGKFCDEISSITVAPLPISPTLEKTTWGELLGAQMLVSLQEKFNRCTGDIERAGTSPAFKATQCGAEIMGFITGMRATAHIQDARVESTNPACAKPIKRLYNSFDAGKTMCVTAETDPLLVAKIFTKNFDLMAGKPGGWAASGVFDGGAMGAVGYKTIYQGYLCRNEAEIQAKAP